MRAGWTAVLFSGVFAAACGGAPPPRPAPPVVTDFDVPSFLLEVGRSRSPFFTPPEESTESLEALAAESRGDERREVLRKLAIRKLLESEEASSEEEAVALRLAAVHASQDARARSRNKALVAEMAFVDVWSAWRAGRRGADERAAQYTQQQSESGELGVFAWVIRGEIALASGAFEEAAESYRFLLGMLEHPLYAFALYRTAHCYRGMGREIEAAQALREVEAMGRAEGASEPTKRVAAVARGELASHR